MKGTWDNKEDRMATANSDLSPLIQPRGPAYMPRSNASTKD